MNPVPRNDSMGSRRNVARIAWIAGGIVAAIVAVSLLVAIVATSRQSFLAGYKALDRRHVTLQSSSHKDIACDACHVGRGGGVGFRAALVGDFYRGLVSKPDRPAFVTLAKPPREACLACHRHDWSMDVTRTSKLPHPAHLRVTDEKRDCVKCHKWTAHEEEYMEKHKTMRYSAVCAGYGCHVGTRKSDECDDCHHGLQKSLVAWKTGHRDSVRARGANGCFESCHEAEQCRQCHTTGKRPKFPKTLSSAGSKAIEQAHLKGDWMDKHGRLARSDEAKCLQCHVSVAECEDCHAKRPAFHGLKSTWLGRHKDMSQDKRRCAACHPDQRWCDECHKQFKEMR